MKIGIITIVGYNNYGNRLQNYATQEVLKSLGCDAETIINIPCDSGTLKSNIYKYSHILKKALKMPIKESFFKVIDILKRKAPKFDETGIDKKNKQLNELRVNAFKEFSSKYIKKTPYVITPNYIPVGIGEQYDFFVVGSDQVWNPIYRAGAPAINFLTFAPSEKRISYSVSFGISELPEKFVRQYTQLLSGMAHISVREETGAAIIEELIGETVDVLVDPTMMLSKEQWLAISKKAIHKPEKPYLLTYFLGEMTRDCKEMIDKIVKEKGMVVVNLADSEDAKYYTADPSEFLDYIHSSEIFLTDSFHGTVFSILLEKAFIVFDRISTHSSMYSRIDTLLSKFNLMQRKAENIHNVNNIFTNDYTDLYTTLEKERKKALAFLTNAMKIKDDD